MNPAITESPPVGGGSKGGRKNRNKNNNDDDKGDDSTENLALGPASGGLPGFSDGPVPRVGEDEGKESLKIRIKLNLQAKVRLDVDADIKGEIVIGLL